MTSLIQKLWRSKVQAFIVESTSYKPKAVCMLPEGFPFYERTEKMWLKLFTPLFTVDVVSLETDLKVSEPQSLMHLEPKEMEEQSVPKTKRR